VSEMDAAKDSSTSGYGNEGGTEPPCYLEVDK
jgi:hypothetical protein